MKYPRRIAEAIVTSVGAYKIKLLFDKYGQTVHVPIGQDVILYYLYVDDDINITYKWGNPKTLAPKGLNTFIITAERHFKRKYLLG